MKDYYMMWLSEIKGIKKEELQLLIKEYEYPENVWKAKRNELDKLIGKDKTSLIFKSKNTSYLRKKAAELEKNGVRYISIQNSRYPYLLKNIYDPPWGLYVKGELPSDNNLFISIVGSRKCSDYSAEVARKFSYELAGNGVIIVSGMAEGIDSIANQWAIEAGGKTIAALGTGIDICFPKSKKDLMEQIAFNGCVITEYPPGTPGYKGNFPRRNRIISGLSQGLLLIEAGRKSGTRTTVDSALDEGRDVFVVPGDILGESYAGSNEYISNGAHVAVSPENIMEYYNYQMRPLEPRVYKAAENSFNSYNNKIETEFEIPKEEKTTTVSENPVHYDNLSENEMVIMKMIEKDSADIETITQNTEIPVWEIQGILTALEIKGLIKQISGNRYVKA